MFEEGALVVVYENECESVANALMQELKKDGYRVFATSVFDEKTRKFPITSGTFFAWEEKMRKSMQKDFASG